jgi:hypothetical protein
MHRCTKIGRPLLGPWLKACLGLGRINAILLLRIQIQLKYTIVSKITSHTKDEGKKEAKK